MPADTIKISSNNVYNSSINALKQDLDSFKDTRWLQNGILAFIFGNLVFLNKKKTKKIKKIC